MGEALPKIMDLVADVAGKVLVDIDQLVAEMDAAELEFSPDIAADAAFVADISACNRANVARLFSTMAREDKAARTDVPPEALDFARTVARRGIDFDALFESYRRGQNIVWRRYMAHATSVVAPGEQLVALLEVSSQRIFEYVDHVVARVITEAQREREEVLGGALARRTETIRLILDGAPIDTARASERLGYDLTRGRHTAIVLWSAHAVAQGALESAANLLARAADARPPLTLPAGTTTLWAWLVTTGAPALDALQEAIGRTAPGIRVAVGPARTDIAGFRRSHAAAVAMQRLLAAHPDGPRLALHHDMEVTELAGTNLDRAAEFVDTTLGPLAENTPAAARLRETLRIYLEEAENAPRAATRLHTHRNTILKRITRTTELLGREPGERRLATELALELAHQLGPRVLTRT